MSFIPSSKVTSSTPNGSNTAPAFSFSNDSDTGLYSISNGVLGITTNAVLALSINSSQQLSLNSHKIISLLDPTSAQDAATKIYVDNVAAGLDVKAAVRVATTTNLVAIAIGSGIGKTLTAVSNGAISVDGTSLSLNDRVLVKNQTISKDNGIYTVTTIGTGGTPYVLTRATDFDGSPANEVQGGDFCFVEAGTQGGSGWTVIFNGNIVVDTDNITWTQFNATASYIADESTLHLSGNTFSIKTGTSPIFAADGSAAAPAYSFSSGSAMGMYRIGANILGLSTNGTEAVRIDSSQKVGIGVSPASIVHVKPASGNTIVTIDSASLVNTGAGNYIDFDYQGVEKAFVGFGAGTNDFFVSSQVGGNLILRNNSIEYFRIDSSGKIGINTTTTSANYQMRIDATNRLGISIVSQASASAAYLFLENNGGNTWNFACDGTSATLPNNFELAYNGVSKLIIDIAGFSQFTSTSNNGMKILRTASAGTGATLALDNTTAGVGASLVFRDNGTSIGGIGTTAALNGGSDLSLGIYAGTGLGTKFFINNSGTSSLTISSSGLVGIGRTPTTNKLEVQAATDNNSSDKIQIFNSGTGYCSVDATNSGTAHGISMGTVGSGTGQGNWFTGVAAADSNFIQGTAANFVIQTAVSAPISFGTNNTLALQLNTSQQLLANHTNVLATPAYSFVVDSSSGMNTFGAGGRVDLVVSGTDVVTLTTSVLNSSARYQAPDGSAASPSYQFTNNTSSGLYNPGGTGLNIVSGGTIYMALASSQVTPGVDNSIDSGSSSKRWANVWGATIHSGDVQLENNWRITEGEKIGHPDEGIMFVSPSGKKYKIAMTEVE